MTKHDTYSATGRHLTKLATLDGVRELTEGEPVELWLTDEGHVVLRAYNECGNNYTEIDALSLLDVLKRDVHCEIAGAVATF